MNRKLSWARSRESYFVTVHTREHLALWPLTEQAH